MCSQDQLSVNEIRAKKFPGLTDRKVILVVLDQMLDEEMVMRSDGLRGGQKTKLYTAKKDWSAYNKSA
jgi:hypothetical protein